MPLESVIVSLGQPENVPIRMSEKGQQKGKEIVYWKRKESDKNCVVCNKAYSAGEYYMCCDQCSLWYKSVAYRCTKAWLTGVQKHGLQVYKSVAYRCTKAWLTGVYDYM